jgi:hypothetical protein
MRWVPRGAVCDGAVELEVVDAVQGGVVLGQDHMVGDERTTSAVKKLVPQYDGTQF